MAKTFILTGASRGLGAAIADSLLRQAHNLVLSARSASALEDMKRKWPGQVDFVAGDLTAEGTPQKLVECAVRSFGRLDGLVVNHGMLDIKRLADVTPAEIRHAYEVNVFSGLAIAQASLPELRKTRGCIVWVSSGAATGAYIAWGAYGSTKAAVDALSRHIAVENPDITSVAITPGRVDTGMQQQIRETGEGAMDEGQYASFVRDHEEGTLLRPEQPGGVLARFVAGPEHSLSGRVLRWNGPELAAYQS